MPIIGAAVVAVTLLAAAGTITVPDSANLYLSEWALELDVRVNAQPGTAESYTLVERGSNFRLIYEESGGSYQIRYGYTDAGATARERTYVATLAVGRWYHLTADYDSGTGDARLFIGERKALGGSPIGFLELVDSGPLASSPSTAAAALVVGPGAVSIEELRVWDGPRTQAQYESALRLRPAGNTSGLVGYWRLDEGDGDAAYDRVPGAGDDGVVLAGEWTEPPLDLWYGPDQSAVVTLSYFYDDNDFANVPPGFVWTDHDAATQAASVILQVSATDASATDQTAVLRRMLISGATVRYSGTGGWALWYVVTSTEDPGGFWELSVRPLRSSTADPFAQDDPLSVTIVSPIGTGTVGTFALLGYDSAPFRRLSSVSATSSAAGYPASNLLCPRPSTHWRSTSLAVQTITIDHGAPAPFLVAQLVAHNLTSAATVLLEVSNDAGFSAGRADSVTYHPGTLTHLYARPVQYRYERWTLTDAANPDGYLEAGTPTAWACYEFPSPLDPQQAEGVIDGSAVAQLPQGAALDLRTADTHRSLSASHGELRRGEALALAEVLRLLASGAPCWLCVDADRYLHRGVYGYAAAVPEVRQAEPGGDWWSMGVLTVTEARHA